MAMVSVPSSPLQLSKPLFTAILSPSSYSRTLSSRSFSVRAADSDADSNPEEADGTPSSDEPDAFDSRLAQVRLRYRSGTGKKADVRKSRKSKKSSSSSSSSSSGAGVFLPPVPLKEAVSGGLKVDFGFSPYTERVNGRIAMLGLGALLSVELATGQSVINYHSPAIIFLQVYFVAAASALFIKFDKERVSIWPRSSSPQKQ